MPENDSRPRDIQNLYQRIAPVVESVTGYEPQVMVRDWNAKLFTDMRSEAEVLMLMHGQSVSDRYLYGLCCTLASVKEENEGYLPLLTDGEYEINKERAAVCRSAGDDSFFLGMESAFSDLFPLTTQMIAVLQKDLLTRLHTQQVDLDEGFVPGAKRAIHTLMPLFAAI